jgi:2'-5' RNA ligase
MFPSKGPPKIIWIGVGKGHPHLFQLHQRVQDTALAVGLEADLRPWHPHITLARCHGAHGGVLRKFLKSNAELDVGMFRVDAFHLYCSELTPAGPIHTCEMSILADNRERD